MQSLSFQHLTGGQQEGKVQGRNRRLDIESVVSDSVGREGVDGSGRGRGKEEGVGFC